MMIYLHVFLFDVLMILLRAQSSTSNMSNYDFSRAGISMLKISTDHEEIS
jgi:hypothetical protein